MKYILLTLFVFNSVFYTTAFSQQTIKDLTVNDFKVVSTTKGSKPCPLMTETQRNALTATNGLCVYNTTTKKLNTYDGSAWQEVGGGGGIDNWLTATVYAVDDIVVFDNKIYQCEIAHTSGVFATDLADFRWIEISQGVTDHTALTNIGINTHAQIDTALTRLANTSGTNTGDQDLSNYVDLTSNQTIAGLKQFADSVGIGGAANANAILDVQSTTKAFLPPRMTTAQMNAIASPVEGMTIYNTDFDATASYNGTTWVYGFGFLNLDNTFSAKVSSTGIVTDENIDWIEGNCTSTSPYTCTFKTSFFSVAPNCFIQFVGDTGDNTRKLNSSPLNVQYRTTDTVPATINAPVEILCQKQGADYLSASSNAYATTNADTDWQSYVPASFQGFGSVTNVQFFWRKQGPNIQIQGSFISGIVDANEARISLPISLLSSDIAKIPSLRSVGISTTRFTDAANTTNVTATLIEPSVSYMTFQRYATSLLTKASGIQIHSDNSKMTLFAEFPIQGWANSPFIVGSFQGYNYTSGVNNVDTFSFSYGTTNATTVCSASPCSYLDQIGNAVSSITRVASGEYALNTVKTYSKLKCTGTSTQNAGDGGSVITGTNANNMQCLNCNSMPFSTVSSAFSRSDSFGTIFCQGTY